MAHGETTSTVASLGSARHVQLNPDGHVPLYHQIFLLLRNGIYSGELCEGARLPGEQDLAAEFNVSRITAKRAMNELAEAGLVVRERGRGTRVVKRPPAPAVVSPIEGWLENISLMGLSTRATVLDFDYVPATDDIAHALNLCHGDEVQRAVRVRSVDSERMSYLVTYVPGAIGRKFCREQMEQKPLLLLLELAGVDVAGARQTISATLADAPVAQALGIHVGAPLIEVRRVVQDSLDRPVEYLRVLYRPDLYHFEMSMRRVRGENGRRWTTTRSPSVPADDAA